MPWNEVPEKFKSGALRSGGSGQKVTSKPQMIAIMLSEKRKADAGDEEYKAAPRRKSVSTLRG